MKPLVWSAAFSAVLLAMPAIAEPIHSSAVSATCFQTQGFQTYIGVSTQYRAISNLFGKGIYLGPTGFVTTNGKENASGIGVLLGESVPLSDYNVELSVAGGYFFRPGETATNVITPSVGCFNNKNGFGIQVDFPFLLDQSRNESLILSLTYRGI